MFKSLLIANRGEIALRVTRTARRLGLRVIAVYSDPDRDAAHVAAADEAYRIGPAPAAESYLSIPSILGAARRSGAEAIHPGYGFLSEKAEFAEACEKDGLVFVGPPASAIRAMGAKDAAKRLMQKAGVPVVPGTHDCASDPRLLAERIAAIGYPVLVKAVAGGGGRGMRRVDALADLAAAVESASREAKASFGDGGVLVEKLIEHARHIEVQVFADTRGNCVSLFERDCSLQRRHQKVIEEAPAPGVTPELRARLGDIAVKAARAVDYRGAGTVELIADVSNGLRPDRIYFMEMNTRLQVEHPVTEAVTGLDLVEWQLRVASGEPLPRTADQLALDGHAVEARIYAEDPAHGFRPATGRITQIALPEGVRIDSGVRAGDEITPYYDPMIAKAVAHAPTRAEALARLAAALDTCVVMGVTTNTPFLAALLRDAEVAAGVVDTGLIERNMDTLAHLAPPSDAAVTLAALAALDLLDPPPSVDPWYAFAGWRAWGEASSPFRLQCRGVPVEGRMVVLGNRAFRCEHDGRALGCRIVSAPGEALRVELDGRLTGAAVARAGTRIDVAVDSERQTFAVPAHAADEGGHGRGSGRVVSPITGVVGAIRVAPGERVAKGAALLIIEAMKLEHAIAADVSGTVADIFVRSGEPVHEGADVVSIEPES
jgi:3-methylcrotonyl-CoA carboxylase alpha subunit